MGTVRSEAAVAQTDIRSILRLQSSALQKWKSRAFPFLAFVRRSLHACTSAEMAALK
jgi:hypothetical protein